MAGLGDLIRMLNNTGLIDDYNEIRVSTSRNPVTTNKPNAVRATFENAPRETDPIRTAELTLGPQSYLDLTLKTVMKANEKLENFLGSEAF